jgi:hypothetical protein
MDYAHCQSVQARFEHAQPADTGRAEEYEDSVFLPLTYIGIDRVPSAEPTHSGAPRTEGNEPNRPSPHKRIILQMTGTCMHAAIGSPLQRNRFPPPQARGQGCNNPREHLNSGSAECVDCHRDQCPEEAFPWPEQRQQYEQLAVQEADNHDMAPLARQPVNRGLAQNVLDQDYTCCAQGICPAQ